MCDRPGIDTKLWSQSTTCPPQLKGRDSAFKGLPHTLRCKQVNPKYLQSLLEPIQEIITGFAVWLEVFKSIRREERKNVLAALAFLGTLDNSLWGMPACPQGSSLSYRKRQENCAICNPPSLSHPYCTHRVLFPGMVPPVPLRTGRGFVEARSCVPFLMRSSK